jgi:hypothetical protein
VDFTREPIIETIITPKEGYKLVIRSSTSAGQEEYFVDAVEIVAFGHALFFRSQERPKAFLVPVSDYEILEVREARMVLKNAGLDRSIKIGGGREGPLKVNREIEKGEVIGDEGEKGKEETSQGIEVPAAPEVRPEVRVDKKRDRRRHYRKRKGREEGEEEGKERVVEPILPPLEDEKINIQAPESKESGQESGAQISPTLFSSLLQPPPTLISETINRYRQNEMFKNAFYLTEEEQYKPHDKVQELLNEDEGEETLPSLQDPDFVSEENSSESSFTDKDQDEGQIEEPKILIEEEGLIEIQKQEPTALLSYDAEEEDELKAGLPLYAEEDTNNIPIQSPYSSKEDEPTEESHSNHHEKKS